ncbi:MAG: LamG domain-containing protein [Deltaproteobacteria bacterium]|nr:LamG domain-containing protein [Deltaproteobacteria bacterium]
MTRNAAILTGFILLAAPFLAACEAAAQGCTEPPADMIGWWPGDGNGDNIQSQYIAAPAGGADYAPGIVGEAFRFDGVGAGQDDRVYLPARSFDGLVDMTVELWVNTTEPGEAAILSGANETSGGDNELLLFQYKTHSDLMAAVKGKGSGRISAIINDGRWHHLAFTRGGGRGRLFVDGNLAASRSFPTGALDIGPGGIMLGQEQDCRNGCFQPEQAYDGLIDEVSLYGRALSQGEILQIVDAGGEGKCRPHEGPSLDELFERVALLESDVDTLNLRVDELETALGEHELGVQRWMDSVGRTVEELLWRRWRRSGDDDDDDD